MTSIRRLLFLLLLANSASGADWPRWRGPLGDGHVPAGVPVPETLPAEPKVVWKNRITDGVGSPVVANGRVFYLDQGDEKEVVHALDAATGNEVWKKPVDDIFHDSQARGPRSTPVVDGDRVYVQSCKGEFQCLKTADGALVWRKNFVSDFGALFFGEIGETLAVGASRHGNDGAAIVEGDNILVQAGGTNGASVVCLKKKTGEVVWKSQSDQAGYAAAYLGTVAGVKQVIAFTADGVIGLETKSGRLLWRFPIHTMFARHVTTPVVVDDIVMVSSHQRGLFGIKVSKEGATQSWLTKEAAINFASPVVVGPYLFGLGPNKNLICVDTRTGKITWSKEGFTKTDAGHSHIGLIVMERNILALTDYGELVLFAVDPKEFREISRVQVAGINWCNPAYADGKLYLRDAKHLYCVAIK